MADMTGRERILAAFRHAGPDRTPFSELYIKSPTSDAILRRNSMANVEYRMDMLIEHGHKWVLDRQIDDTVDIVLRMQFDSISLGLCGLPEGEIPKKVGHLAWRIGDRITRVHPISHIVHSEPVTPIDEKPMSLEEALRKFEDDIKKREDAPADPPSEASFYAFDRSVERLASEGVDVAITSAVYSTGIWTDTTLMQAFVLRPDLVRRHYAEATRRSIVKGRALIERGTQIIGVGGDFAYRSGPLISPGHYRDLIMPAVREQSDALHEMGALTFNASDGNLWPVIDDFLNGCHVDGYAEVEYAAGMDLGELRRRFPDKTFIGNVDCSHVLTFGTQAEVKQHTIECIEKGLSAGTTGGHVLAASNAIHEGVPPQNYFAVVEAYREFFGLVPLKLAYGGNA